MKRFFVSMALIVTLINVLLNTHPLLAAKNTRNITNLQYRNADIRDLLTNLGASLGVTIILDPAIQGQTTFNIADVSFETGLTQILEPHNYMFIKQDNIYYIVPRPPVIKWVNNRLTIEAKNTPLTTLFSAVVREAKLNISWDNSWIDRIHIYLYDMSEEEAMSAIARQGNLYYEKNGAVYEFKKNIFTAKTDNIKVVYDKDGLSIEADRADIYTLARIISEKTGYNVQVETGLTQQVSGSIQKMGLQEGLLLFFGSINRLSVSYGPDHFFIGSPGSNKMIVNMADGRMSAKITQGSVQDFISHFRAQSNIPLTCDPDVTGPINAEFNNLELLEGLAAIADNNGLTLDRREQGYHLRRKTNNNISIRLRGNGNFDIKITDSDLTQVLRELATKIDANILISSNVGASIKYLQVKNVSFEEACKYIMQGTPYRLIKKENIFIIANVMNPGSEAMDILEFETFYFTYLPVETFFNSMMPGFLNRSTMVMSRELNAILVFGTREQIEAFRKYKEKWDTPLKGNRTKVIPLKYIKAQSAFNVIPNDLRNNLMMVQDINALSYTGTEGNIQALEKFIAMIDIPIPIISCDITVLQISREKGSTYGLQGLTYQDGLYVASVSLDPTESISGVSASFDNNTLIVKINALLNSGKAKVITSTNISTLNNVETTLDSTTKYQIRIPENNPSATPGTNTQTTSLQSMDTGLSIRFTPWVSDNNDITLQLSPSITEFLGSPSGVNVYAATSNTRKLLTTIRVKDKQTFILGGLIQRNNHYRKNKVPILGDIPILGYIFSYTTLQEMENEFVIIITPRLLKEGVKTEGLQSELHKTIQESGAGQEKSGGTGDIPGASPTPKPETAPVPTSIPVPTPVPNPSLSPMPQ
ncbi:MAG: hypothetical protein ACM3WV_00260 [Bacillota bacterium]